MTSPELVPIVWILTLFFRRRRGLSKLELVDLMPPSASLACLSTLKDLRHLIVEYKDGSAAPNLRSIGQLQGLTQIELSLHR